MKASQAVMAGLVVAALAIGPVDGYAEQRQRSRAAAPARGQAVPRSAAPPRALAPRAAAPRAEAPRAVTPRANARPAPAPRVVTPGPAPRAYGYAGPRAYRVYPAPYGWRPYGYGPGWSLNFYFGRPYAAYGYGPAPAYGYYAVSPSVPYGALRIVNAPPNAQVFVDGYYAGVVDHYDGVFQHLNLEVGAHRIEIEVPGYQRLAFDVYIRPGETVTYRAGF